ncbi:unnamed protein product [Ceratitis capitata]|uniref:(Mediterranean fruit fly) hypothetical protein n=1 Tax=Ceratitis capitata TaxID=7213 RepID=A0A811UR47_CERCA|nr:unnamed protein product [Ceratitis capitata]
MDLELEQGRKSIAQFRKSIYGGDEVEFADIFHYDMDEQDHTKILTVMRDSLHHLPDSFRADMFEKLIEDHPELRWDTEEPEIRKEDVPELLAYESLLPHRWQSIHDEFDKQLRSFSSTFSIRDPDKFWTLMQLQRHPEFELSRMYAIQKLANDVNNSLYMIYKGIAWVDIFKKSLTEKCLDSFKFRYDIMELVRLLKPYFLSFCTKNSVLVAETLEMIKNASNLLEMHNKITDELEKSVQYFMEKIDQITNISVQRRSVGRDVVMNYLEMETLAYIVRDPIEQRYHMNYMRHRASDWQNYTETQENAIMGEVERIRRKQKTEEYCNASIMQCYYGIIGVGEIDKRICTAASNNCCGDYKNRIETMSKDYEQRFNQLEDKNRKLRYDIDNMKLQHEFLLAEKEYFRQQISEVLNTGSMSEKAKRSRGKRSLPSVSSTQAASVTKLPSFKSKTGKIN